MMVLLLAGLGLALAAPASRAARPSGPAPSVVVRSGDTLWSLVDQYVPGGDPRATIEEIRQLNGLSGYTIRSGQRLVLPRTR
jgi:LysM repeat protein